MRINWILGLTFSIIAGVVTYVGASHMVDFAHSMVFSPIGSTLIVFACLWGAYMAGSERRR